MIKWTKEAVLADAAKYETKADWRRGSSAYYAATNMGCLVEACAHMKTVRAPWTKEEVFADAKRFQTRSEWASGSTGAYIAARKNKWLDEACVHMTPRTWTDEEILEDARKYTSRADWRRGQNSSYSVAWVRGLLPQACRHMREWIGCEADVVYIWRVVGWEFNGSPVYKIGVTSNRLGQKRIKYLSGIIKAKAEVVMMAEVLNGDAQAVEAQMLMFGANPNYTGIKAASEFRAMSDEELRALISFTNDLIESMSSEDTAP
jgi:hypothetical protein